MDEHPYENGYAAYYSGEENPYEEGTEEHERWWEGYGAAAMEE